MTARIRTLRVDIPETGFKKRFAFADSHCFAVISRQICYFACIETAKAIRCPGNRIKKATDKKATDKKSHGHLTADKKDQISYTKYLVACVPLQLFFKQYSCAKIQLIITYVYIFTGPLFADFI